MLKGLVTALFCWNKSNIEYRLCVISDCSKNAKRHRADKGHCYYNVINYESLD